MLNQTRRASFQYHKVYAKLQDRAEDQALVARLQGGLSSPTYVQLRERISDPNFQYSLQAGMYRCVYYWTCDKMS